MRDVFQVSSANYQARAFGICADMCIGEAKRLCPDVIVMPYQYEQYQIISEQVSHVLSPHFISPFATWLDAQRVY